MKRKHILIATSLVALCAACSQQEEPAIQEGATVNFTLGSTTATTRTVTTPSGDVYASNFTNGDEIGIYTSGAYGGETANGKFTVSGSSLTGPQVKIEESATATFYAYSPYQADQGATVAFCVKTDQSTTDDYNASNFLTAKAQNAGTAVAFNFNPKLSLVRVEMTGENGVTTTDVKINAQSAITWTPSTDAVAATGAATAITFLKEKADASSVVFTAFVPAQTIAAGSQLLVMTVGTKTYQFKPTNNVTLAPGQINKIKVNIASSGDPSVTTENITFSGITVNGWTVNEITVGNGEVTEVVVPPIELITEEAGTFSSETALPTQTGLQGCLVGWNALLTDPTQTTIAYDETEAAMKIASDALGDWYQKALVYRTSDNAGSLGKYKLTFKVKTENQKDIIVRIIRGQTKDVFISNAYFCTGTNGFSGQALATKRTSDDYLNKTVEVDFSQIKVETQRAATIDDLATGIAIMFQAKTKTDVETIYIKDVKFVEVKE